MKHKKFLALLLSVLMLATCSVTAFAAGNDVVEITYSYWGTPDEAASVQAVADKFNSENDHIHVTVLAIPNEEYTTTLNSMAAGNQLPDCGIMNENGVLDFAADGLLADVSSMYDGAASMPLDSITFKADGAPVAYSAANEILFLYYNKDMFDAAGVAYPDPVTPYTWDEFVETAKLLTLDGNGNNAASPDFDANNVVQYGANVDNWTWQLEVWALSNGGRWFSEDGAECLINTPEVAESIQKVADLYLVDHVAQFRDGLEDSGIQSTIAAGNVAMATGGTWNVGTCMNNVEFPYGVAPLPVMKNEVTICTGGPQVVFAQGEHQAEAMEFIKWYTKEENSWDSLIATGIWMPILEEYYTNEELTHKWVDNDNFTMGYDNFKTSVVDYAHDYAVSTCWYYVPHTNEFLAYLRSILGDVWTGSTTAADALNAGEATLIDIFNGE
ncbi:MAG: sugar ABC transporter substrate-binding protein [Oscillospiraceae bacterium]|nr:sugar ABC transporter substrate-binding protein [Oscillospiraceae bacterium]